LCLKAEKTPSSDEVETRQRVQEILKQIEQTREKVSKKFHENLTNTKEKLCFPKKKLKT
jgi:hypothetical protein